MQGLPSPRNRLGDFALKVAIVGVVLALIPYTIALGLLVLIIAFGLALVAISNHDASRRSPAYALLVSAGGFVLGLANAIFTIYRVVDPSSSYPLALMF